MPPPTLLKLYNGRLYMSHEQIQGVQMRPGPGLRIILLILDVSLLFINRYTQTISPVFIRDNVTLNYPIPANSL